MLAKPFSSADSCMTLLAVNNLFFRVEEKTILDGLNMTVKEHEIHALLGSNGTGKSTLAYLVMGCAGYTPTAGEILFGGQKINALPMHERAQLGITLAWQEPARFEGLTVWDYLALGRPDTDVSQCLERVGLAPQAYLDRPLDKTLSGGERKRMELAAILAMKPKLALLDEPDAGIDLLSIDEIADVIQLLKREGSSVLLITHREEIARTADRASYLCGGKIIATGAPEVIAEQYKSRRCMVCDGVICP